MRYDEYMEEECQLRVCGWGCLICPTIYSFMNITLFGLMVEIGGPEHLSI